MSESELRQALLQQEAPKSSEDELKWLRGMIEAEQRRSRRLGHWALVAWIGWVGCLALALLLPHFMARTAGPAGQPPAPVQQPGALASVISTVTAVVIGVGALFLPIVGVVLLVLHFIAGRSALTRGYFAARFPPPRDATARSA